MILKLKAQNAKYKSLRKNITAESKTINRKNDLEGYLLKRDSGFSPEYKFLKALLDQLKTGKISNEEDLENYIKDHFKKLDLSQLLLKQSLYKDLEKILGTYLNDFEKNKKTTTLFNKKFDFTIAFDDIEQYHSLTQKIYGIAGIQAVQKTYEKSEKEKPKSKKHILTEDHKHWSGLVDSRVTAMPMSFIKKIGLSVESLGSDHFNEYKTNEVRIPKAKRKEVALSRFKGLIGIRDYIEDKGSKLQKFHLEASIIGASQYASSIGIDTEIIINKPVAKKPSVKTKKNHGELSKKQIKDRQVYGAIRAYAELMKIDGDMDPNEMMLLGKLSQKEEKKLSGSYNQESEALKEYKENLEKGNYVVSFLLFRHKKKPVIGNDAPIKPAIKTIILPQIPNMLPV